MDALIPPGSLDRIRRVRDWTVEANDLDNWAVVGAFGGFAFLLGAMSTAVEHGFRSLHGLSAAPILLLAASLSGVTPIFWPSTLPVHPLERSFGVIWGALPRIVLSILLHAVVLVLCEPLIGWVMAGVLPVCPDLVRLWDGMTGNPLGVAHGQVVFDGAAWSPATWAARGVGFATVSTANNAPRDEQRSGYSPAALVAIVAVCLAPWPVAVAAVLASAAVSIWRSTERELPPPSLGLSAKPKLRTRRHLVGLPAVARDVVLFARPGDLWAAAQRSALFGFFFASRVVRTVSRGGLGPGLLSLAAFVILAPSALGLFVLGAPAVNAPDAHLSGVMETLPIRSRRYVATRFAQAAPALMVAAALVGWGGGERVADETASVLAIYTLGATAGSFLSCRVNAPLWGRLCWWFAGLLVVSVLFAAWGGALAVVMLWLASGAAVCVFTAQRVLRAVP